ncbi:MAG: TonB-dependent receptor [Bryobacteraceae bacterium]
MSTSAIGLFAGTLLFHSLAMAQSATTGAVAGLVTDASGMYLPGVHVSLVNRSNRQAHTITTDDMGRYNFSLLAPGAYEITFAISGYKTAQMDAFTVSVSETPNIEASMEPGDGDAACTCKVTASGSSSGTLVDEKTITSVPLNTRNLTQVLSISAGSAADVNNAGNLGRNNQAVNVNGNTTAGTFTVDGAVPPGAVPNPDTISELKIDTSQYDAGFGAQVPSMNLVTRSGTNEYHGVLWEFLRNDIFNANAFFRNSTGQSKPNLKQNQYGGTLGGPVKRDKLFFFGSYQGTRQTNGLDPTSLSTLILPGLTADRSAATLAAQFCPANHPGDSRYQTFAGGKQLDCGNQLTSTTAPIHPVALKALQAKLPDGSFLVPIPQTILNSGPNAGLGFSSYSYPSTYREHHYLLNGDYVASKQHTIYGRFYYATVDQYRSFGSPGGIAGAPVLPGAGAAQWLNGGDYVGSAKLSSVLSPSISNEFRVAFTRTNNNAGSDGTLGSAAFGMTPVNPLLGEMPEITILGPLGTFRAFGNGSNDFTTNTNSNVFTDNLSWNHGKQTFRTGAALLVLDNVRNDLSISHGRLTFQTLSDFLIGLDAANNLSPSGRSNVQTVQANVGSGPRGNPEYNYRRYAGSAYLQDDWKLTPRLTLNLGLRWEFIGASFDRNGIIGGVDPALLRSTAIPGGSGTLSGYTVAANYNPNLVNPYTGQPFGPVPAGVTVRSTSSFYANGTPLDKFAPRFGFAWRPTWGNRTSVRGGYGWFYQTPTFSGNGPGAPLFVSPPYAQSFTNTDVSNGSSNLDKPFPTVTLGFVPRTRTSQLSDRVAGPEYKLPLLQQWNLSVQYGLTKSLTLDLGYVGSHGRDLLLAHGLNQPLLASATNPVNCGFDGVAGNCITTNTTLNSRQRVPVLGENPNALLASEFIGSSSYHSLQATLRKQLSQGLSFQFAYTLSKAMNNNTVMNDQNNVDGSWARAGFDRRHRIIANFNYELPSVGRQGFAKFLLGGWSATGLFIVQSGLPMTLTDPSGGGVYGRAATSTVTMCLGSTYQDLVTAGSTQERLGNWLNRNAICSAAVVGADKTATAYGTAGQNVVNGPAQMNTDFSVGKAGHVGGLSEVGQLAFRMEMYNTLNHPQFSNPGTVLGTSNFGVVTQTSVASRIIQFALKYMF